MADNIINATERIRKLTVEFERHAKAIQRSVDKLELINKQYAKTPSEFIKAQQEIAKLETEQARTKSQLLKVTQEAEKAKQQENRTLSSQIRLKKQQQSAERAANAESKRTSRNTRTNISAFKSLNSEYDRQSRLLNFLRRRQKDLNVQQELGTRLTVKQRQELAKLTSRVTQLDRALKRADAAAGQFSRNVGNYPRIVGRAVAALRSFATALGFSGAIFTIVNGLRDAAERVRDFDKTMQNIAGVLRTNRQDLKALEHVIIDVAGSSVKTSNEVAQLAESLFTLGKSREAVNQLLKPVNDLSIALNASSADAGEFLVATLNAFQKPSSEAGKFADIIATIRTSTSLDFQKMRDSFQFLAPISQALGEDLAHTGAIIGLLADNGIKAERAGRLLGTSQQKLAANGLALADALQMINEASSNGSTNIEVLALASDLLGKQSAGLGVILAQNTGVVEKNAEAIRNNSGALKDLVDQQLQSVDAHIKILDSTWEKLILTIENGDNALSSFIKNALSRTSTDLDTLTFSISENLSFWDRFRVHVNIGSNAVRRALPILGIGNGLFEESVQKLKQDSIERRKNAGAIDEQIQKFIELNASLAPFREGFQERTEDNTFSLFLEGVDDSLKTIPRLRSEIVELQKNIKTLASEGYENLTDEQTKNLIESRKLIKEKQAEINSILGIEKSTKKTTKAVNGSISALKNQIGSLKKTRDETSTTQKQYGKFTTQIETLEVLLLRLEQTFSGIQSTLGRAQFDDPIFGFDEDNFDLPESNELDEYFESQRKGFVSMKASAKDLQDVFSTVFSSFSQMYNIDTQAFTRLFEEKQRTTANYAEAAGEALSFVLNATRNSYEEELQANRDRLQTVLDDENATEEQKKAARLLADEEEARIKTKKARADKNAALIQIAIDTGVAVVKALASSPPPANFTLASIVGALGAAQLAFVAAQPLPKFERGTKDAPEGWAITQEKRPEPIEDKDGNLLSWGSNNGDQLTYLPKGAKVYPSRQDYFNENINKASIMVSMASEGSNLSADYLGRIFDMHLSRMKDDVKTGVKEGLKGFKNNIKINNKIDLGHQSWLNKKGY